MWRLREYDRANIPSFDDDIVTACILMQFLPDNLADQWQPADMGNAFVDTIIAQMVRGIDLIDEHARLAVLNAAGNWC
jgi:hypothetical protein